MKKRMLGLMLAAATAAAMTVGAYAGEVTADSVMENMQAASEGLNEVHGIEEMAADVVLSVEGQEVMSLQGKADLDASVSMDPFQAEVVASMTGTMNSMGEEQGGQMDFTTYIVPDENGILAAYAGLNENGETEWVKSSLGEEVSSQLSEMLAQAKNYKVDLPEQYFTLADATVECEGKECYQLTADLTVEDILNVYQAIIEQYGDQLPEEVTSQIPDAETLSMFGSMLSGLNIHVEMDVDTETYLPVRLYVDTEGSDWVTLGAVVGMMMGGGESEDGSLPNIDLNVNTLYMQCIYDYETPVDIVVPEEVLSVAVDTGDFTAEVEEMGGDMLGALESEAD